MQHKGSIFGFFKPLSTTHKPQLSVLHPFIQVCINVSPTRSQVLSPSLTEID